MRLLECLASQDAQRARRGVILELLGMRDPDMLLQFYHKVTVNVLDGSIMFGFKTRFTELEDLYSREY